MPKIIKKTDFSLYLKKKVVKKFASSKNGSNFATLFDGDIV